MEGISTSKETTEQDPRDWVSFLVEKMGEVTEEQIEEFKISRVDLARQKIFDRLPMQKKIGITVLSKLTEKELEDLYNHREKTLREQNRELYIPGFHEVLNMLHTFRLLTIRKK